MELLLIRHATAESSAASDFERALTDVGNSQAEKVGQFLKRSNLVPDVTLASPLVRARQTAESYAAVRVRKVLLSSPG